MDFQQTVEQAVRIVDESYGEGYLLRGVTSEGESALSFLNYGLKEEVVDLIESCFDNCRLLECTLEGFPNAEIKFYGYKEGCLSNLRSSMRRSGFVEDALSAKVIHETRLVREPVLPIDKITVLHEKIHGHFAHKINLCLQKSGGEAEVYRTHTLESTKKDVPFFIVNARIKKRPTHKSSFRESFQALLTEAEIYRVFQEGQELEVAFIPKEHYLKEALSALAPSFPPDKIDGYQRVLIESENCLPSNIHFIVLKNKLLESGACVRCDKQSENALVMDIPCCYALGGTVGRAFESRIHYCIRELSEAIKTRPNYQLLERVPVYPVRDDNVLLEVEEVLESLKLPIGMTRKITTLEESDVPYLFSGRLSEEIHLKCHEGNYLSARKRGKKVHVYHSVVNGSPVQRVKGFFPQLLKLGKGVMA